MLLLLFWSNYLYKDSPLFILIIQPALMDIYIDLLWKKCIHTHNSSSFWRMYMPFKGSHTHLLLYAGIYSNFPLTILLQWHLFSFCFFNLHFIFIPLSLFWGFMYLSISVLLSVLYIHFGIWISLHSYLWIHMILSDYSISYLHSSLLFK